ncbi:MAG: hypothetical protein ABII27_00380 [bacterium]
MTPDFYINQDGKKVFEVKEKKDFIGISIEKGFATDEKKISVARCWFEGFHLGDYVNLRIPASISVIIYPGSSGLIGPWFWVRGLK